MDPLMEIDDNSGTVCGLSTLMFGEFYANFRMAGVLAGYLTLLGFAVLLGSALDHMTTDADLVQWVNIVVPLLFITRGLPDFSIYLYHAATLFMIFTLLRWAKGRRGHRSPSSLSLAEAVT